MLHLCHDEGPCEVDLDVAREFRYRLVHERPMEGHAGIVDQPKERAASQQIAHLPAHDYLVGQLFEVLRAPT